MYLFFEPAEGFEPTTPILQITCSGQLSYAGVYLFTERKSITFFFIDKIFSTFFYENILIVNINI